MLFCYVLRNLYISCYVAFESVKTKVCDASIIAIISCSLRIISNSFLVLHGWQILFAWLERRRIKKERREYSLIRAMSKWQKLPQNCVTNEDLHVHMHTRISKFLPQICDPINCNFSFGTVCIWLFFRTTRMTNTFRVTGQSLKCWSCEILSQISSRWLTRFPPNSSTPIHARIQELPRRC